MNAHQRRSILRKHKRVIKSLIGYYPAENTDIPPSVCKEIVWITDPVQLVKRFGASTRNVEFIKALDIIGDIHL